MKQSEYCSICGELRTPIISFFGKKKPSMVKRLVCPSCEEELIRTPKVKQYRQQMTRETYNQWVEYACNTYGKNKLEWPKHLRSAYRLIDILETQEIKDWRKAEHPSSNTGVRKFEFEQLALLSVPVNEGAYSEK